MAKIEDFIAQIPDERLRKAIAAEVRDLKKNKKFGLVFEEHLPETVRLPNLPVKVGDLVAKKRESGNQIWKVRDIRKGKADLVKPVDGYPTGADEGGEVPVAELVVVRSFGDPVYPALIPVERIARGGPDKPWNVLINSDNFHALQLLLYCYEGQVDVIYIDPPYNSGARDWKYNNDYVDAKDTWRHSKWLAMMQKRLRLAKRLLNPRDSVLIVTIDEKEYLRLGLLLGQLFPEARVQMVSSVINQSGVARDKEFYRADEYLFFVFIGEAAVVPTGEDMLNPPEFMEGKKIDVWNRLLRRGTDARREDSEKQFYPFWIDPAQKCIHSVGDHLPLGVSPDTVMPPASNLVACWPIRSDNTEGRWQISASTARKGLEEGTVRLGAYTKSRGRWSISYLRNAEKERIKRGEIEVCGRDPNGALVLKQSETATRIKNPVTVWNKRSHNAGAGGSNVVQALIPGRRFPFPKSLYAVEDTLSFFVKNKPDSLVLDFFAGSGTTAHAVMRLNHLDNGRRRSISITNNEVAADEQVALAEKGLSPGDSDWEKWGIFNHITMPRLVSAITGKTPQGEDIKGDYKFGSEFPFSQGLHENMEFFVLDFLDPDEVARGDSFKAILPVMWMMAGCRGEREDSKGSTPWFIPKRSPFAVLIRESEFREFRAKLAERKDIEWLFLVTDSEENFAQMRRTLGRRYQCVQLYKSYLENFRINLPEALRP
jgi:adenine-specific DNA-methyltransferase